MRRATILVIALLVVALLLWADATRRSLMANEAGLSFYNKLCISIFELKYNHQFKYRDDLAGVLVSRIAEPAKAIRPGFQTYSRTNCIKPGAFGYEHQIQLELSVKHQILSVTRSANNIIIVGGGSPNARNGLSEYELEPIIIAQESEIGDEAISVALIDFVVTRVLRLLK
jgi:hypothetical protein